jgi:hypothetical protein
MATWSDYAVQTDNSFDDSPYVLANGSVALTDEEPWVFRLPNTTSSVPPLLDVLLGLSDAVTALQWGSLLAARTAVLGAILCLAGIVCASVAVMRAECCKPTAEVTDSTDAEQRYPPPNACRRRSGRSGFALTLLAALVWCGAVGCYVYNFHQASDRVATASGFDDPVGDWPANSIVTYVVLRASPAGVDAL